MRSRATRGKISNAKMPQTSNGAVWELISRTALKERMVPKTNSSMARPRMIVLILINTIHAAKQPRSRKTRQVNGCTKIFLLLLKDVGRTQGHLMKIFPWPCNTSSARHRAGEVEERSKLKCL